MATLYTVYKCKSKTNDTRIGPSHFSDNAEKTLCGMDVNDNWFISDNTFSGTASCEKCKTIDETTNLIKRTEKHE